MENLKKTFEGVSLSVLKIDIIKGIIKDAMSLANTIEFGLRNDIRIIDRDHEKKTYKVNNLSVTVCNLKPKNGITMYIEFKSDDIYNKIILECKDNDYNIEIIHDQLYSLMALRADLSALLLYLTDEKDYTYKPNTICNNHAIILDGNPVGASISINEYADRIYDKLIVYRKTFVCDDYGSLIFPDYKAAYLRNGLMTRNIIGDLFKKEY